MLLNISTDRIISLHGDQRYTLEYGELEKNVPAFLYGDIFSKMIGDSKPIVVINGPGSFTNLRIMTLALNSYNVLHDLSLDFISITKVDYYRTVKKSNLQLKRYCLMYMGQKKNFWIVDLEAVSDSKNALEGITKVHVDNLKEHMSGLGDTRFVDEMVAEGKDMIDSIFGEGEYDMYSFRDNEDMIIAIQGVEPSALLDPQYMMEANVN